ncbi:MAG: hypothetical protein Q4C54_03170 [Clostridia bacterium]|nr:hypothetical protein [Clostridia bacterium]
MINRSRRRQFALRIASLVLMLTMVLHMLPVAQLAALADPVYVARIGTTNYTSYAEAWNAAVSAAPQDRKQPYPVIDMLADWTTTGRL